MCCDLCNPRGLYLGWGSTELSRENDSLTTGRLQSDSKRRAHAYANRAIRSHWVVPPPSRSDPRGTWSLVARESMSSATSNTQQRTGSIAQPMTSVAVQHAEVMSVNVSKSSAEHMNSKSNAKRRSLTHADRDWFGHWRSTTQCALTSRFI